MNTSARCLNAQLLNRCRPMLFYGGIIGIGALTLGISACGGGSSSPSSAPVVPPSYTLNAGTLNPSPVTAGNHSTSTVTLTPANGYSGSVSLSCGTISGGTQAPTCSFSPSSVTVSGVSAGTSTLTIFTSINTPGGSYAIGVIASDANKLAPATAHKR